jgi:hypothetical protein
MAAAEAVRKVKWGGLPNSCCGDEQAMSVKLRKRRFCSRYLTFELFKAVVKDVMREREREREREYRTILIKVNPSKVLLFLLTKQVAKGGAVKRRADQFGHLILVYFNCPYLFFRKQLESARLR